MVRKCTTKSQGLKHISCQALCEVQKNVLVFAKNYLILTHRAEYTGTWVVLLWSIAPKGFTFALFCKITKIYLNFSIAINKGIYFIKTGAGPQLLSLALLIHATLIFLCITYCRCPRRCIAFSAKFS